MAACDLASSSFFRGGQTATIPAAIAQARPIGPKAGFASNRAADIGRAFQNVRRLRLCEDGAARLYSSRLPGAVMESFAESMDRRQGMLLPECLDGYLTEGNPVRVAAPLEGG